MPLSVAEIRDLRTFSQAWANLVIPRDGPSGFADPSTGFNLGIADGATDGGFEIGNNSIYDHIRDRVLLYNYDTKTQGPGFSVIIRKGLQARDVLCQNTSVGWFTDGQDRYTQDLKTLKAGQPNLQIGAQKLYSFNSSQFHFELDPLNGDVVAPNNVWPTASANDLTSGPIAFNTAGYYTVNFGSKKHFGTLIFEGMITATGYSELTRGSSYPLGLALRRVSDYNIVTSSNVTEGWVWIDLNTNEVVGVLDIPTLADSTSVLASAEPTIDGKATRWSNIQFVPDAGTSFAEPKGELHVFTMEEGRTNTAFEILSQTVSAPEQTFTSTTLRNFVTVYDFNPYNSQLGPVRVHNRRIFLGIVDTPQEPIISGGFNATGVPSAQTTHSVTLIYHPPSRTYINIVGIPETVQANGANSPVVGNSRIIRLRRAFVVDHISQPTPDRAVTENVTIQARVLAHTDLGALAVSAQINFTLFRRSTRAETFDGTATGAGTYTVEALEIDDDNTLDVRSINDVDNAGTLLVDGVDYTFVAATGVLTPIGSWPTEAIFVRYRHRQVELSPGHGTLLTSSGSTDSNGSVFALVRYGANVDAEIDALQAALA